jgi:Spy/CpxP family protein refolding chaperone
MNRKLTTFLLVAMLAIPFAMFAQSSAPTTAAPSLAVPISGSTNHGGKVTGTFHIQKFANQNNQLVAILRIQDSDLDS